MKPLDKGRRTNRTIAPVLFGLALACSDAPTGPVDWHVSEFPSSEKNWQPEADFRFTPPSPPRMAILEVSRYPHQAPTDEQRRAAAQWIEEGYEAARTHGWFDYDNAVADGFELIFEDKTHYANREFFLDDVTLDPNRPEVLMYYDTARGKKLAGYMFYVGDREQRGEQVGGPLTVWHYHWWPRAVCMLEGLLPISRPDVDDHCSEGQLERTSPEMIHLWLIDHPKGRFATNMSLPQKLFVELIRQRESDGTEIDSIQHSTPEAAGVDGG
ncbi:hypothetical protein MK489_05985 [Myxococcota bacterium]|nr:hypothetical protein [Myxococcota bacterium]